MGPCQLMDPLVPVGTCWGRDWTRSYTVGLQVFIYVNSDFFLPFPYSCSFRCRYIRSLYPVTICCCPLTIIFVQSLVYHLKQSLFSNASIRTNSKCRTRRINGAPSWRMCRSLITSCQQPSSIHHGSKSNGKNHSHKTIVSNVLFQLHSIEGKRVVSIVRQVFQP